MPVMAHRRVGAFLERIASDQTERLRIALELVPAGVASPRQVERGSSAKQSPGGRIPGPRKARFGPTTDTTPSPDLSDTPSRER